MSMTCLAALAAYFVHVTALAAVAVLCVVRSRR